MTAEDYEQFVGKRIKEVQYEDGSDVAILETDDGYGIEINVDPTYKEE